MLQILSHFLSLTILSGGAATKAKLYIPLMLQRKTLIPLNTK